MHSFEIRKPSAKRYLFVKPRSVNCSILGVHFYWYIWIQYIEEHIVLSGVRLAHLIAVNDHWQPDE